MIGTQCVGLIIRHECCHPRKKKVPAATEAGKVYLPLLLPYEVVRCHPAHTRPPGWALAAMFPPPPLIRPFFLHGVATQRSQVTHPRRIKTSIQRQSRSPNVCTPYGAYVCPAINPAFCLPSDLSSSGKNVHISNHEFLHMMLSLVVDKPEFLSAMESWKLTRRETGS